eukprot:TRINITY_DN7830_c0_g1_i2.p1 TRINITY_DN7830_c0_g1~~TRINITY_DN7830_c0_g1_i2.p1  ORF type:complete len:244 (-),score=47.77 TRINITY_DN7830_c0_g1_i2:105-836(-)
MCIRDRYQRRVHGDKSKRTETMLKVLVLVSFVVWAHCQSAILNQLTRDEIVRILDAHNKFRGFFAQGGAGNPQAANMKLLVWDNNLALNAGRWASQIKFAKSDIRTRETKRYKYVGENIAILYPYSRYFDWYQIVTMWTNEVVEVTPEILKRFTPNPRTDEVTQILWANTEAVGCGKVTYRNNNLEYYYIVCQYGPSGNVPGEPVYYPGRPCAGCPQGSSCSDRYPGLCNCPGRTTDQCLTAF